MTTFLDFFAREGEPFYACVATKGYGVVRYVGDPKDDPSGQKFATARELAFMRQYGVPHALVYETTGGVYDGAGYFTAAQGRYDAVSAVNCARAAGYPDHVGLVIFFAVDTDVTADEAVAYFNAAYDVLKDADFPYTLGVYGGHNVTGADWPAIAYRWQTPAWSHGVIDAADNLYQYDQRVVCGVTCDLNDVKDHAEWAWQKEEGMATLDELITAVEQKWDLTDTLKAIKDELAALAQYHGAPTTTVVSTTPAHPVAQPQHDGTRE